MRRASSRTLRRIRSSLISTSNRSPLTEMVFRTLAVRPPVEFDLEDADGLGREAKAIVDSLAAEPDDVAVLGFEDRVFAFFIKGDLRVDEIVTDLLSGFHSERDEPVALAPCPEHKVSGRDLVGIHIFHISSSLEGLHSPVEQGGGEPEVPE